MSTPEQGPETAPVSCAASCCQDYSSSPVRRAIHAPTRPSGLSTEGDSVGPYNGHHLECDRHHAHNSEGRQAQIKTAIEAALERVNASMSTYRSESELSRFNRQQPHSPSRCPKN